MRIGKLEKAQAGDDRMRHAMQALAGLFIGGLIVSGIMLVTTNQTAGQNASQIGAMDLRQRTMQITQGQHGKALERIEKAISPRPRRHE